MKKLFAFVPLVILFLLSVSFSRAQAASCPTGYIDYGLQSYPAGTPGQFYYGSSNALMLWVTGDNVWSGGTYSAYFCEINGVGSCTLPTLLQNPDGSSQYANYQCGVGSDCTFYYCQPQLVTPTPTCIPKGKSGKCR